MTLTNPITPRDWRQGFDDWMSQQINPPPNRPAVTTPTTVSKHKVKRHSPLTALPRLAHHTAAERQHM